MNRKVDVKQGTEISPPAKATGTALSRRALLRAGAGASPVLLTLASSPVLANGLATNVCTVASSFVSVATFKSRNPTATSLNCSTQGQSADYWRNLAISTPATESLNVTVASLLGPTGSTYNDQLVVDVLRAPSTSGPVQTSGELGTLQHLIALALNLQANFIIAGGGFDLAYVKSIWSNYKGNGNIYKKSGTEIDWDDSEIIAWARLLLGYSLLP